MSIHPTSEGVMLSGNGLILGVCAFVFSIIPTGCNQGSIHMTEQKEPASPDHQVDRRTVVPLVRTLDADGPSATIEFEFDVQPQSDDPEPPVFIGLRVAATDPAAAAESADRLRDARIDASVRLYRVGPDAPETVALSRSRWTGRSEVQTVPVDDDGHVPELFATTADVASMRKAGLLAPAMEYKELEFAFIRDTPPGRYRVAIALNDPRRTLQAEKAELLIAHTAKSR
jgi:hypothetical protein